MYHRKNHFLFRGIASVFGLILLVVLGSLLFRTGFTQGMLLAGGEMRSVAPITLDTTNILVIFGGIITMMILGFIFRLIYWRQVGKERMTFFAEHKGEFPGFMHGRSFRHHYHYPGHACYAYEERAEKTSSEEKDSGE